MLPLTSCFAMYLNSLLLLLHGSNGSFYSCFERAIPLVLKNNLRRMQSVSRRLLLNCL